MNDKKIPVIRPEDYRAPRKTAWQMFKEQIARFFRIRRKRGPRL